MEGIKVGFSALARVPSTSRKILSRSSNSAEYSVGNRSPCENAQPPVHDLKNAIA